MKALMLLLMGAVFFAACDDARVFEKNSDFENRSWVVNEKPVFEFDIADSSFHYNIYTNVRNSVSYPYSRLFLNYDLKDSSNHTLKRQLVNHMLFDPKTGEPQGSSGLGDIYDHQVPLLKNYKFTHAGKYKITIEQFMRVDTLPGILAVGVRVEKNLQ